MNRRISNVVGCACASTLFLFSLSAVAADGVKVEVPKVQPIQLAAPVSDDDNYLSDRIAFPVAIWVSVVDLSKKDEPVTQACAPAGTQMRGIGKRMVAPAEGKPAVEMTIFLVEKIGNNVRPLGHLQNLVSDYTPLSGVKAENNCAASTDSDGSTDSGVSIVKPGQAVILHPNRIDTLYPVRKGVTFGSLLVPYKYHSSGEKGFSGGATLGGYLGYRVDRTGFTGFETNFVAFAGGANVAVPVTENDTTTISNRAGFSYGVGLLATVKDEFQLGLVVGRDRVDESANYSRNGKTWVALSFGYEFSN